MAYIEIEKAIAEIDKGDLLVGNNAEWAKEIIRRTPTADVEEVRHGEWVEQIRDYGKYMVTEGFKCSVCGYETMDNDKKYCSECGAKMEDNKDGEIY